jgi:protocatechuate 3,4-dioxygenase beta subunit
MSAGAAALMLPSRSRAALKYTPTADIGPFYPIIRPSDVDSDLTMIGRGRRAKGQIIEVSGRVLSRDGQPVSQAIIEIWQANAAGRYAHASDDNPAPLDEAFQGFGRIRTNARGEYRYTTIKPGAYPDGDSSPRPPHIHLDVSGSRNRIVTQMIFPGEPLNETDDVLANLDRTRLTAAHAGRTVNGADRFNWDIVLFNG